MWKGANGKAPECPADAPMTLYEGYAGLNTFSACGPCECSPATCELPEDVEVSTSDGTCGGSLQSVEVPEGWDGSCVSIGSIDTPTSIRVGPTRVGGCEPVVHQLPRAAFTWNRMAKACGSLEPMEPCEGKETVCVPGSVAPRQGFEQCIVKVGDQVTCPPGYSEGTRFYSGVRDTTLCTLCTCRRWGESTCDATLRVHGDASCTSSQHELSPVLENAVCGALPGSPPQLASVETTFDVDEPGTCSPEGGQLHGTPTLQDPVTFCCRPAE
ncbi:Hypothetical protein CAP_4509 [Chondromyces apiculatus DSM 436]|uniref:Uncharacterized protein n=1 Tax=Chondromyces apiculatus DSM 436 TaxID=1192034 RepID=A0A017T7L3_9BACT|nr:Hypothetical protein CAP_4509 [Chondromyces apiculatus DSM 436]